MTRKRWSTTYRVKLFAARGGVCHICAGKIATGDAWDLSHPHPLAMGGDDEPDNHDIAHRKCHRVVTTEQDIPAIAKAKRREARHIGAHRSARPMPGSRASNFKRKLNGTVEKRT
jgi:5-methylcytosine-specific restriction enzyme A